VFRGVDRAIQEASCPDICGGRTRRSTRPPRRQRASALQRQNNLCYQIAQREWCQQPRTLALPAMDPIRRTILVTGVTAVAAGTRWSAAQTGQGGVAMGTYEK